MRIAVLGASGTVGRALVPLLAEEHDVVAVSRRPPSDGGGIHWEAADATDGPSLRRVLAGVDVVYYLVHSLGTADFEERDRLAAETTTREAERAGVRQLIYLGGLGDEAADLSPHLRSRAETADILGSGGVPVTTVRAAMVIGAGSAAFETIVALVDRLPGMICPRWVSTPTQPIALADIAAYLAAAAGREEMLGRSFDAGGPDVMTYREMIEGIARIRGKRPLIVEVPVLTPRLSSYWLMLVTPVQSRVARPLIEGLRNATVAHDESLRELVPLRLTPFDDAARAAISARRGDDGATGMRRPPGSSAVCLRASISLARSPLLRVVATARSRRRSARSRKRSAHAGGVAKDISLGRDRRGERRGRRGLSRAVRPALPDYRASIVAPAARAATLKLVPR